MYHTNIYIQEVLSNVIKYENTMKIRQDFLDFKYGICLNLMVRS